MLPLLKLKQPYQHFLHQLSKSTTTVIRSAAEAICYVMVADVHVLLELLSPSASTSFKSGQQHPVCVAKKRKEKKRLD